MGRTATLIRRALPVVCAVVLLVGAPLRGTARQTQGEHTCRDARTCMELLEDGIDLIEAGRWAAASVVLEEVAAGLEGLPSHVRDLARALVNLGVARLQIADADETRQLFAEAQVRDPALQLDPAEFPRDVLEIWEEARELGVLVVESEPAGADVAVDGADRGRTPVSVAGLKPGEYRVTLARDGYVGASRILTVRGGTDRLFVPLLPMPDATAREADAVRSETADGVSATARRLGEALAEEAPADVLTTAQRLSADTSKRRGRSMWRTLVGVLAVAGGATAIASRDCTVGAASHRGGTPVEVLGGTIRTGGFRSWNRTGCVMEYAWDFGNDVPGVRIYGTVADHELLKSGDRGTLSIDPGSYIPDPAFDVSLFEERLPAALVESVGGIHSSRIPTTRLIGGLTLAGVGALLATIWSEGGVVVEEVAVSVTPSGGVLASRSFSW